MPKISCNYTGKRNGFHLNLQIIADSFADKPADITLQCTEDLLCLDGLRLYQPNTSMEACYLYFLAAEDVDASFSRYENLSFLILGKADLAVFSESCRIIQIQGSFTFSGIFNAVQQTFEQYINWDEQLQLSLSSLDPLNEMLKASLEIFNNPIFVHDTNFYILSSPRHVTGLSKWVRDNRTGRLIAPLSLIHEFQLDPEYHQTLSTRGPHIYSEALRGYRVLYMNLWTDGNYQGRLCVSELQSAILDGQLAALQYLGSFIELCIKRHNLFQISMGNDTRQFFSDFISGKIADQESLRSILSYRNWSPTDRYMVVLLEKQQQDDRLHSSIATIGHIEAQIPEGIAFTYQEGIVAIVNLSYKHSNVSEVVSSLAIILREGLFKMGISSEFRGFHLLPQGYLQASWALRIGSVTQSTDWCYRFDDYLFDYLFAQMGREISPELLVISRLSMLRNYDRENHTELYLTLKTYLEHERNALRTAEALFIHRSTLTYRLERIHKLTQTDFSDYKDRLLYQICFMLDQEEADI